MPRSVGLALASKLYRQQPGLPGAQQFSKQGNEVVFVSIGDGSTSEGHFFETMNAAGVLQIPMAVSVWDEGYAISVRTENQTIKASRSKALKGFANDQNNATGLQVPKPKAW